MSYDVSAHRLLSSTASEMATGDAETFEEQQAWAEEQLGVAGTSYTGKAKQTILRAIALQINWQLGLPKDVWYTKQMSSIQSKQNVTYRDGIPFVDPRAAALVAQVEIAEDVGSRYGDIRSIR